MKQEPNSRGLGIPRLQAGEQVNNARSPQRVARMEAERGL